MMHIKTYIPALFALLLIACSGPKLDRSVVPAAGPAPAINIGKYETFTLQNGLKVIAVENKKLPRVSYQITVDRGPLAEGDKAGYASMAGDLLKAGTASRSKAEIDEAIDFLGARLSTYSTGLSASSLSKNSDALLELMKEVLLDPTFPEEELEKLKKKTLSGLASSKTSANEISSNISAIATYGKEHPYGEPITEASTEAITRDDLMEYYNTYFRPNSSCLVIVGDIDIAKAKSQAEKYFGDWKAQPVEKQSYPQPQAQRGNRVVFVPLRGAVQSVIDITTPVNLPPGHPDAIAASVMSNILGGGVFGGRLMQNLREDKAFTYGARAFLNTDPVIGSFSANASVRNEVTDSAVTEFLYEIERITAELVEDTTLRFIKNYMNGSFARSLEQPQTIARFALNIERYQLPKDYYSTYLTKLEAVTKEDILRVAKKYIDPNRLNITVVGNKEEVGEKLAVFAASGEVEYFDLYGNPYSDLEAAPEGMTADDVFEAYYTAIGGEEALMKINSSIETGTMTMGPMALAYERKTKYPGKMNMTVKMGEQMLMQQVVNGKQGVSSQMGQAQAMSEEEIGDMQMQIDLFSLRKLGDYGMRADLKGIGAFEDEPCYVVDLFKGDELASTLYFSLESGLQVGSESSQETPQGDVTITSKFLEYKEAGGVKFVSNLVQLVGPQTIEIKLDDIQVNRRMSDADFKLP